MTQSNNASITFISAGAGSGKTHRLTEILRRELTGKRVRPSGVIATTFTKKAATELRERVREHLLEQGDFVLANAMGQARIGTVNSVCGQLIERFAFEAGMSTEQEVLEETQAAVLLGKAIDAVMDGPAMGAFLGVVRRLGLDEKFNGSPERWKEDLQSLVNQIRSNDISADRVAGFATANAEDLLSHFPKPATDDLTGRLKRAIGEALPKLKLAVDNGCTKKTNDYVALLRGFAQALVNGSPAWGEWVKLSKAAPEAGLKPLVEPIAEMAGRVAEHPDLRADITGYLVQMFDLAAKALEVYSSAKRELGALDFADQEHLLLRLLDDPAVGEVLAEELDLLMVDEFQDTNPIQLALFLKLARFARQVYWVGDIKQAIYGFRGSDTELMRAILEALPSLGGSKEVLPNSWRSREELVRLVNSVFSHAFGGTLPKDEVELCPVRKDKLPGAPLANWILSGKNKDLRASALAAGVGKLVDSRYQVIDKGATASRNVRFGDIAILSRSNSGVDLIAAALRAQGIPSATAQPGLLATPEATLALACLRRLNDPGDTIATAEVVSLADCAEPETWVADRLRYLSAGAKADAWMEEDAGEHKANPLVARIAALRKSLPLFAPREAVQTIIAACNLPSVIVRWSPDAERTRQRLANLEALVELAGRYEDLCASGQHAASISGLIIWLGEIAGEKRDMLAEPAIDAVKVMTHHAAKGLEWPVVILMDLAADVRDRLWSISARSGAAFDVNAPLEGRFIRYWPWPFGKQKNVGVADDITLTPMAAEFRRSAVEEEKRLLYVSMTRARDLMVLVRAGQELSGEWLDCVDSPWLLPEEGADELTLPTGEKLKADRWSLDPVEEAEAKGAVEPGQLHWFAPNPDDAQRPPLNFVPSGAESTPAEVVEKCRVGERIPVGAGVDMNSLGNAIHASLALSFSDPSCPVDIAEVERLLDGFGVRESVAPAAVAKQAKALQAWISSRWPGATAFAEYPVQGVLESGQVLNGRIDLLLSTRDGWVIIDHKSTPMAADQWDRLAGDHGAQIGAYAAAVTAASGRPVHEAWLFLPVAGGSIRLSVAPCVAGAIQPPAPADFGVRGDGA